MIPKVLHWFWEGGDKPRKVRTCLASWRRLMPDWEVKEWNAANWDVSRTAFSGEAARLGRWAFVSDVARWDILAREGGVFLDADVELVKPLDDLCRSSWMAAECDDPVRVNPGLGMAFAKGATFARAQVEAYARLRFDPAHGLSLASPEIVSRLLDRPDAPRILPARVMNPLGWSGGRLGALPDDCHAIHWYAASWMSWRQRLVYVTFPRMGLDVGRIWRRLRAAPPLPFPGRALARKKN